MLTAQGPYSKFRVGAAVLTRTGECIPGANVENAAYPVGTCAERIALGTAIAKVCHSSSLLRSFVLANSIVAITLI